MTAKRKIYIISICFFVIFTLAIIFGITPLVGEIKKSSENLIFQKRAFNLFQSQLKDLENFQKNYSLYQSTLERIEKSFVVLEAPIDFIEFLEKEAQKSDLKIEISPLTLPPAETDPWGSTGFQISVGGPFPSCLKFLERLERSPYLVEIFQLNIERIEEKGNRRFEGLSPGDVSFNIALKAFYED
ncbi:hypothetical protein KJA17_00775 [Patescibacteria group bacterium]|nr:hypothetical protein [Patescibacteria group bacterium]